MTPEEIAANPTNQSAGEMIHPAQVFLRRRMSLFVMICFGAVAWVGLSDFERGAAVALVMVGSLAPIMAWTWRPMAGLPFGPLIGAQSIAIYATPLLTNNEVLLRFEPQQITRAAFEVAVFGLSLAIGMSIMGKSVHVARPRSCHRYRFLRLSDSNLLRRMGPVLLAMSAGYLAANISGTLSFVPAGMDSILRTLFESVGLSGALLSGYFIGARRMSIPFAVLFWVLFAAHSVLRTVDFTLFPTVGLLMSACLGLFMGSGKPPVLALVSLSVVLGFFNLSKFEMRAVHWIPGESYAHHSLSTTKSRFTEWFERSWEHAFGGTEYEEDRESTTTQSITDRVNNLINLLQVQSFIQDDKIPPLHGETYWLIPKLLIPRILWPDKPRTHEGMVRLNVYFGRQTFEQTFHTYVSWGLLPEAYGNFGPLWGALLLGGALGIVAGWAEIKSLYLPLNSLECLLLLTLLIQLGGSAETVASVWITSMFQMMVAITAASMLFVDRERTSIETT